MFILIYSFLGFSNDSDLFFCLSLEMLNCTSQEVSLHHAATPDDIVNRYMYV